MASDNATAAPARRLRTNFIVDGRFQGRWILLFVVALFVGACAVSAFLSFLPDSAFRGADTPARARRLIMKLNAAYFCLAATLVTLLAVALTHRVAGAAQVIQRALGGFRRGNYAGRLNLRRNDYLQELAAEAKELGQELGRRDRQQRQILDELQQALDRGEMEQARATLARLRGGQAPPAELARG